MTPILSFATGAFMTGEAAALFAGLTLNRNFRYNWRSIKNVTLLVVDGLTGAVLIAYAFCLSALRLTSVAVTLSFVTHIFRILEPLTPNASDFCFNRPLFVMNGLKSLMIISFILSFF